MANTHWQCKDCLNKACLAILTDTITQKYFYMAGQKSRKLYYCPIQQMAKLQLNPVKAQSTSWNAVFIHLQFQNTGFFIHYTIQTPKYKSTPIRRCCPISFGNSRTCANAASNQNPQHWSTVDHPIRELHKENMRSTLLYRSICLFISPTWSPKKCTAEALGAPAQREEEQELRERKREWCLGGKWAPHSSSDSCAVVSLILSKCSSSSLFPLSLSLAFSLCLFIKLTCFLLPALSLSVSRPQFFSTSLHWLPLGWTLTAKWSWDAVTPPP